MRHPLGIVIASAKTVGGCIAAPLTGNPSGGRQKAQRRRWCLHRNRHQRVADRGRMPKQGFAQGLNALIDRRQIGQQLTIDFDAITQSINALLLGL